VKNKNAILIILFTTLAWVFLSEDISLITIGIGIAISIGCVIYCYKFLPLSKITGVKAIRLIGYPLFLIGQIYLAGVQAIKLILSKSEVAIVEVNTKITNDLIKVILANSITLIPGTVSLDTKEESITVLWLKEAGGKSPTDEEAEEIIKGSLERRLIKAQG